MLIISDGSSTGVNPIFPLIPIPYWKTPVSDIYRLMRIVPLFIAIQSIVCAGFLFYLLTDVTPSFGPAYMSGGLFALIVLRVLFRKIAYLQKEKISIVGVAPKSIWIDHILLCAAYGFGFLMNAKINHLALIGLNFYSTFAWLCFSIPMIPLLNLMAFRRREVRKING